MRQYSDDIITWSNKVLFYDRDIGIETPAPTLADFTSTFVLFYDRDIGIETNNINHKARPISRFIL